MCKQQIRFEINNKIEISLSLTLSLSHLFKTKILKSFEKLLQTQHEVLQIPQAVHKPQVYFLEKNALKLKTFFRIKKSI